jgi:hypothetical protein
VFYLSMTLTRKLLNHIETILHYIKIVLN